MMLQKCLHFNSGFGSRHGNMYNQLESRTIRYIKVVYLKIQESRGRMIEFFVRFATVVNFVQGPICFKLCAFLFQILNKRSQPSVFDVLPAARPEISEQMLSVSIPFGTKFLLFFICKHLPDDISFAVAHLAKTSIQQVGRLIPGNYIPSLIRNK